MTDAGPHPRVLVVGAGLIGTSIALALTRQGSDVLLDDRDAGHVEQAIAAGAGRPYRGEEVDVAVVAVPPGAVPDVVCRLLQTLSGTFVSDTASVKEPVQRAVTAQLRAERAGTDAEALLARYVGGHPLAGSEQSGPAAAHADLFTGRRWVLTRSAATAEAALAAVRALVTECGAEPVVMDADQHDRALAFTSHLPQVVASLLASDVDTHTHDGAMLAGQGLRDMIRIAGSDPALWQEIITGNAANIVPALDELSRQLRDLSADLQAHDPSPMLRRVLEDGRAAYRRVAASRRADTPG